MDRRKFIKVAGAQAGVLLGSAACSTSSASALSAVPRVGGAAADVVVIGGGAFGGWTAYHLQRMGHQVTLVDLYGPGNSRATSGDETRGVRTGYGENELWSRWAKEAIVRWEAWDAEWGTEMFTRTGDLCMRPDWDGFLINTMATWDRIGVDYERITSDDIRRRYPQIDVTGLEVGVFEPDAGVARARFACLMVAEQFRRLGGEVVLGRASFGEQSGGRLVDIALEPGDRIAAQSFVFAVGPWFPKVMPDLLGDHIRIPLGHVFYYGARPGDLRFNAPNCPSYNFPGVTGWPILGHDSRGFRVRVGGRPGEDPDTSIRFIPEDFHDPARRVLTERFPDLADAPLVETRACHYEISDTRNFIIDRHPEFDNVWIAGGGNAEGFKFGPMLGPYIADRVAGRPTDSSLDEAFRLTATNG